MRKAMNQKENFLAEVHSRTPEWNLNLYVIRMWDVPTKYNPNELWYVEMILQDSKGERMHAVLSRSLLKRWGKVLKEFHLFNMRWFVVVVDNLKLKTTETNMVLTFSNKTQVTPLANPSFPLEALRMKPIGDLLQAEKIDDAEMFDVVALVVGREDPREMLTKQEKELKRLQIIVEDIEKNRTDCALFDQHVDVSLPFLDGERDEPLIVVLQYFRATRWNGRTSIQSNFAVSKVHINPELSEVVAFRERKNFNFKNKNKAPKCYECGEVRHIKPNCPKLKKGEKDKKSKKKQKAYISWENEDETSSEFDDDEVTNLCLMASEEKDPHTNDCPEFDIDPNVPEYVIDPPEEDLDYDSLGDGLYERCPLFDSESDEDDFDGQEGEYGQEEEYGGHGQIE
ncbi:hypothetical protein PIB30_062608 [Stylosanthes scabra]|uniref:CCHC-type domain-containing protein n=1 Tax=Stylosanthes scabra TaxID=79078 RepID=A0ABU6YIM5_9FABA|nr:hypothetical protein [Stylosanthes scabra]